MRSVAGGPRGAAGAARWPPRATAGVGPRRTVSFLFLGYFWIQTPIFKPLPFQGYLELADVAGCIFKLRISSFRSWRFWNARGNCGAASLGEVKISTFFSGFFAKMLLNPKSESALKSGEKVGCSKKIEILKNHHSSDSQTAWRIPSASGTGPTEPKPKKIRKISTFFQIGVNLTLAESTSVFSSNPL